MTSFEARNTLRRIERRDSPSRDRGSSARSNTNKNGRIYFCPFLSNCTKSSYERVEERSSVLSRWSRVLRISTRSELNFVDNNSNDTIMSLLSLDENFSAVGEASEVLEPFYVTTAINYTNGPPHMGHAYEAVTTDAVARYHRAYDGRFLDRFSRLEKSRSLLAHQLRTRRFFLNGNGRARSKG